MAGTGVVETQWFVARADAAGGPIIDEAVVVAVIGEIDPLSPDMSSSNYCDWRQCHHVDTVVPHC